MYFRRSTAAEGLAFKAGGALGFFGGGFAGDKAAKILAEKFDMEVLAEFSWVGAMLTAIPVALFLALVTSHITHQVEQELVLREYRKRGEL